MFVLIETFSLKRRTEYQLYIDEYDIVLYSEKKS